MSETIEAISGNISAEIERCLAPVRFYDDDLQQLWEITGTDRNGYHIFLRHEWRNVPEEWSP